MHDNDKNKEFFYELLQIALGQREALSRNPVEKDWVDLFEMSLKQAIAGVIIFALDKISKQGVKPPMGVIYEWIGACEQIKSQNQIVNRRCVEITKYFADAGFRTCILKGQGNALMYPEPLSRNSGDIDLWVEGSREVIHDFVVKRYPDALDGSMHIEFPIFADTPVEVHYKPRYSSVPRYNQRLQAWFNRNAEAQFTNMVKLAESDTDYVCIPTATFNAVQQMSHIMGHFFVEGIGLRQFVDYFYVLKKLHSERYTEDFEKLFKDFGMLKFARGVMWIEKEILGLGIEYLLVCPNEKLGKVILKEIEEGGNFGYYDQRYAGRGKNRLIRGAVDSYRLLKLACYFPEEALWKIVRKVENQKWKIGR